MPSLISRADAATGLAKRTEYACDSILVTAETIIGTINGSLVWTCDSGSAVKPLNVSGGAAIALTYNFLLSAQSEL